MGDAFGDLAFWKHFAAPEGCSCSQLGFCDVPKATIHTFVNMHAESDQIWESVRFCEKIEQKTHVPTLKGIAMRGRHKA
jgi:hypothetical protein